jgi:hypothetical protein
MHCPGGRSSLPKTGSGYRFKRQGQIGEFGKDVHSGRTGSKPNRVGGPTGSGGAWRMINFCRVGHLSWRSRPPSQLVPEA